MNFIQDIFVDSLNGFPVAQLPLFLFQMIVAGLLAFALQFILNKKIGSKVLQLGVLIAVAVTILSAISKYNLPFTVLAAAAILLFLKNNSGTKVEVFGQFLFVLVGIGCGVGSVVLTAIGVVTIIFLIIFTPFKD
ncbi:MAG: hypothetical protein ACPG21_07045 [Crocinitomicaceae bacterium]